MTSNDWRRRMVQTGLLVAAATLARSGLAQTSLHALGGAASGYDTNIMSAADHPPPGMPVRQRDGFLQLQAGLALLSESARYMQSVELMHSSTMYFDHQGASAGADRLSWSGIYLLSPRSSLELGAEVARGRLNLANLMRPASATSLSTRPGGTTQFLTSSVSGAYRYEISPVWALRDGAAVRFYRPLASGPQSERVDLDNAIGLERQWARDSVGFGVRTGYFVSTSTETVASQNQMILGAFVRWRRELTLRWSTSLEGGAVLAAKTDAMDNPTAAPTARGAVVYATDDGQAEAYVQRTMEPNLLVNQNYITDAVGLRGMVPLVSDASLVLSGSVGYLHNRRVPLTPDALRSNADLWMADVALGWAPIGGLMVEARYQHFDQKSDSQEGFPPTYSRDVALLTLRGMFPYRRVSGVLSAYSDRVDRNDPRRVRPSRGDVPVNRLPPGGSGPPAR